MRSEFLPFARHPLSDAEIAAVADVLRSAWITTGPKTREFEAAFAAAVNAPGALALNSCTAALHTALVTLGIGPGDEVITTPMTFAASVNVIEHVGAKPILVDVEADTLNIDPVKVAAAIGPRSKAIIAVHYAGHAAELDALQQLAQANNLTLIEDAAHALPTTYKGRLIGSADNPVAFSFYATKNLTTAEGGALTAAPQFLERARMFALHGMTRNAWNRYEKGGSWFYEIAVPGFKYNMTDVAAAMGLVQLGRLTSMQERRTAIVERYQRAFAAAPALQIPICRAHVSHAWHLYVLRLNLQYLRIGRNAFIDELNARKIGTSVHFIPIHIHPYYRDKYGFKPSDLPIAYDAYTRMLSLPLYPTMSDADVDDVCEAVLEVIRTFSA